MAALTFNNKKSSSEIVLDADFGEWLVAVLKQSSIKADKVFTFRELQQEVGEFADVFFGELFDGLRELGLLVL